MYKTYTLTIDVTSQKEPPLVYFNQEDYNTAQLIVHLRNGSNILPLSGTSVEIVVQKLDNNGGKLPCTITDANNGIIEVVLSSSSLAYPGQVMCEIHITKGENKLVTPRFKYVVGKSLLNPETLSSTNEYPFLQQLVVDGKNAKKDFDNALIGVDKKTNEAVAAANNKFSTALTTIVENAEKETVKAQSQLNSIVKDAQKVVDDAKQIDMPFLKKSEDEMKGLRKDVGDTNKRMDNIVANGNKDNTEVVDARLGADGIARGSVGSLVREIHKQQLNDERKSQLLQQGLNVLNAPVASPLNIEIQGRTLVNMAGTISSAWKGTNIESIIDDTTVYKYKKSYKAKTNSNGAVGNAYVAFDVPVTMSIGKNYVIRVDIRCESAAEMFATPRWDGNIFTTYNQQYSGSSEFVPMFIKINRKDLSKFTMLIETYKSNFTYWIDTSVAVYDVPDEVYAKINVDPEYSGQKLADKFPYVQGVQHLNPVVTVEGGNLIPPLSNATTSTTSIGSFEVESSYKAIVKATSNFADFNLNLNTPCVGGQTYAFSCLELKGWFSIRTADASGKEISRYDIKTGMNTFKFTVPENAKMFIFWFGNNAAGAGTFYIEQPMLVLGDKPKPFVPRNPSYLYTNTVLAGQNGVNDLLYQEDGQWKVMRKWERDVVLDGTKNWFNVVNKEGFKIFGYTIEQLTVAQSPITQKPTGLFMKREYNWNVPDTSYIDDGKVVTLTIPNVESGYSQDYVPVLEEIKAYFNGWKVKTADANGKPIAWKSVVDGSDAPTQTLAYVRANRAPNYTPYKLTYQLATLRVEPVQVEGDLAVSGMTQVAVDSGVVVREKANPKKDGVHYYISSQLSNLYWKQAWIKNKASKFIQVYKNGVPEIWEYGKVEDGIFAMVSETKFDPTAEYTVTYLVQDKHQFTTNPIDVKATFNQSIRATTDELTVKQSDAATSISILQNIMTNVLARLKANSL